jgi:hypothetical protein
MENTTTYIVNMEEGSQVLDSTSSSVVKVEQESVYEVAQFIVVFNILYSTDINITSSSSVILRPSISEKTENVPTRDIGSAIKDFSEKVTIISEINIKDTSLFYRWVSNGGRGVVNLKSSSKELLRPSRVLTKKDIEIVDITKAEEYHSNKREREIITLRDTFEYFIDLYVPNSEVVNLTTTNTYVHRPSLTRTVVNVDVVDVRFTDENKYFNSSKYTRLIDIKDTPLAVLYKTRQSRVQVNVKENNRFVYRPSLLSEISIVKLKDISFTYTNKGFLNTTSLVTIFEATTMGIFYNAPELRTVHIKESTQPLLRPSVLIDFALVEITDLLTVKSGLVSSYTERNIIVSLLEDYMLSFQKIEKGPTENIELSWSSSFNVRPSLLDYFVIVEHKDLGYHQFYSQFDIDTIELREASKTHRTLNRYETNFIEISDHPCYVIVSSIPGYKYVNECKKRVQIREGIIPLLNGESIDSYNFTP